MNVDGNVETIVPVPYKKTGDTIAYGQGEGDLTFPHRQLHLGTLIHLCVQQRLTDRGNETPMPQFIDFMNKTLSEGGQHYGDRILYAVRNAASEIATGLNETVEKGWQVTWFSELPFEPVQKQIDTIAQALKDRELETVARSHGFSSLNEVATRAITDPDFTITHPTEADRSIDLRGILSYVQLVKNQDQEPPNIRLMRFITSIASYYFFRFDTAAAIDKDFDIRRIPQMMRRMIASTAARSDLFGLSAKTDDEKARDVIRQFGENSHRFLLDLSQVTDGILENHHEVLSMIRDGRIRLHIVEIKTQETGRNASKPPEITHPIPQRHMTDMGHTVFAMYQYLTRMSHLSELVSNGTNTLQTESLLRVMKAGSPGEWIHQMKHILAYIQPLLTKGQHFQLVRVLWPIIDITNNTYPYHGMPPPGKSFPKITTDISEVDHRLLRRAAARASRKFFEPQE